MQALIQDPTNARSFERPPFVLEVCAGSAKLSYTLMQRNMQVLAVDYDRNRHNSWVPVVIVDLSDAEQCLVLLELIESEVVDLLFLALPCGTCSRAREIAIPGGGPVPLRSETEPWGLPHLQGHNLERLEKANTIYLNCLILISAQRRVSRDVIIENPSRSILWFIPQFAALLDHGFKDVEFQHCRWTLHSPSRDKWTRLRSTVPSLHLLSGRCCMQHKHLPWGRSGKSFATADEAEYPLEMCEALAENLSGYFSSLGFAMGDYKVNQCISDTPQHKRRRAAANRQPRGRKLPPLISEFKHVLSLPPLTPISEWHKLLRYDVQRGDTDNAAETNDMDLFPVVGIYRTPQEFIEEAVHCTHPIDSQFGVPDVLKLSLFKHINDSASTIVSNQVTFLRELAKFIQDSRSEEAEIHKKLDRYTSKVVEGKSFLAIQWLLDKHKTEWPDRELTTDLKSGFRLTGMHSHTGVFDFEPEIPTLTVSQLRSNSDVQNKILLGKTKSSGNADVDEVLWQQAVEEVDKGWLVGPFDSLSELSNATGIGRPHVSRRFPISQSNKVRAIDDLKESQVNQTYGKCDKLWLMDIDSIISLIRLVEQSCSGTLDALVMSDGSRLEFESQPNGIAGVWVGATFDLHAAYKQLHVHPEDRWSSVISLYSPEKQRPQVFAQIVLPFGASASVNAFNRLSRFLWYVGCMDLGLVWTNFFDDFPVLSRKDVSTTSLKSIELMFKLLGWKTAEGDKTASFAELFSALGVSFNISDLSSRKSFVQNTTKRIEAILALIKSFKDKESMTTAEAESLRGRLQFMETGFFGKVGKSVIMSLRTDRTKCSALSKEDIKSLEAVKSWIINDRPRLISPPSESKGCLLFTDGACEALDSDLPQTTIGALFINLDNHERMIFGTKISDDLVRSWIKITNKRQLVTEAEIFAVLFSFRLWFEKFCDKKLIIFVDSEPTMFSFIRGASHSEICNDLVRNFFLIQGKSHCFQWFSRVPTKSNPADLPSRLKLEEASALYGAEIVHVPEPNFV